MLSFGDLDPIFNVIVLYEDISGTKDGFSPNLHRYTTRTCSRADYILVTLTSFARSQDFSMWKISLEPFFIPTKLVHLYLLDNLKGS